VCLLVGCYEDESEITLNTDGSGTLRQKLVISERLIVAVSQDDGNEKTPPVNKEKVLERIGSALEVNSITQTELANGGRTLEFQGTFTTAEQLFLSKFCRDTLKLRLAPADDEKAAIYCDMWRTSGDAGGPSTTQLYGLAKGLYIKRTVHLPAEIGKTNGYRGKDKNTVSWVMDLRDKEGLAQTRAFEAGEDKVVGSAFFDTAALGFSLPLKSAALPARTTRSEKVQSSQGAAGLTARVSWVSVTKKMTAGGDGIATTSDLEVGIELSWNQGHCPVRCEKPILLNVLDDQNNDLVSDKGPRALQGQIFSSEEKSRKKELTLRAKTPAKNAKKLRLLEGHVGVVTGVVKETVVLENIQELAGKERTGNSVLDKLNFRIKSARGAKLNIEIDGGHKTITSLDIFGKDASKVERHGGGGWGNNYSYDFGADVSTWNKCQIEVIVSQTTVNVPFSLDEVTLP
jgi:hypothetical protein